MSIVLEEKKNEEEDKRDHSLRGGLNFTTVVSLKPNNNIVFICVSCHVRPPACCCLEFDGVLFEFFLNCETNLQTAGGHETCLRRIEIRANRKKAKQHLIVICREKMTTVIPLI